MSEARNLPLAGQSRTGIIDAPAVSPAVNNRLPVDLQLSGVGRKNKR
jgi:hypothetical protein